MSLRPAILLTLSVCLLHGSAVGAADPLTSPFKKTAKTRVKEVKTAVKLALQPVKDKLDAAALAYATSTLGAADALKAAVATVVAARDAMEDAALESAISLSQDGEELIIANPDTLPGEDFHAGGRGTWDDAMAGMSKALDEGDTKLRKRWSHFAQLFSHAAAVQGVALDLRVQESSHGVQFRGVAPPSAGVVQSGGTPDPAAPPQVVMAARLVETNTPDTLVLGVRAATASVDAHVASTAADSTNLGSLSLDEGGTVVASFALDSLEHPQGFIVASLDDGVLSSSSVGVSAPSVEAPDPDAQLLLDALAPALKSGKQTLFKASAAAVKEFKQSLPAQLKDVKSGAVTPEDALHTAFSALRDARETIGLAWLDFTAATAGQTNAALAQAGLDDAGLPAGFQPDAEGISSQIQTKILKQLGKQQSQLGKSFSKFTGKVVTKAEAGDTPIAANVLTSQGSNFVPPMVTGAATPPLLPMTSPGLTDGLAVGIPDGSGQEVNLLMNVQGDPAAMPTMSVSSSTFPDETASALGDISIDPGGTQTQEFGLSAGVTLTGWTFSGGPTATDQGASMVLSSPAMATTTP